MPERDERTRRAIIMSVLPLWIVPGFLDYLCHRRTHIERTSGTFESLTHVAMMAVAGVPMTLGLFCEINPAVLASTLVGFAAHTSIAWIDIGYTAPRRPIPPFEQHVHAGLELLPLAVMTALFATYPEPVRQLVGIDARPPWRLERKRERLPAAYAAGVLAGSAAFVALPYAEELRRCLRAQRGG